MKLELTCSQCGSSFERDIHEVKRSEKKGRRNYCSRACCGRANINNLPSDRSKNYNIGQHCTNRIDKYTPFRKYLRAALKRDYNVDLTLEDLLQTWEEQKGVCPYSGVELVKPSDRRKNCPIKTASLDRKDSSIGYIKDNIQFVSIAVNWMKSTMSHDKTVELCKQIAKQWCQDNPSPPLIY